MQPAMKLLRSKAPLVAVAMLALTTALPVMGADAVPKTTRKVVLEKAEKGYRWKIVQAPVAAPNAHEVVVHVRAVALNRGDLEMLDASEGPDVSGLVVASDAAGDVVAVGKEVTGFKVGDRVTSLYFRNWVDGPPTHEKLAGAHGASVDGVLGDYIVLADTAIAPAPQGLSYEEAATLPTAGLTAWNATAGQRDIHKDDVVLVQGTGGVSIFALQFAAASGARVIVTSSSDEKLQRAAKLGARDGINYKSVPKWSTRVLELTDRHGADLVVDVGGKDTLEQSTSSLAYRGTLSIVGGLSGYGGSIPAIGLLIKTADARGIYVGSRADYLRMGEFIAKHQLHPVIDRTFALDQYQEALQYMKAGNFVGKVVLKL